MSKQGTWYIWDSRGGERGRSTHIQLVNFDLEKNLAEWRKMPRAKITGSIESGRMTYKDGPVTCEFWREDQPNPTPYTIVDNPDPITDGEPSRVWPS